MRNPFKYFNSSPEIIRLTVLMYVKYPLSLRNVEDLLAERGIDICHETVRHWWNRFGPIFAAEIKKKRIGPPRSFFELAVASRRGVRQNQRQAPLLWRAVEHEGEVLEVIANKRRDRKAALILLKRLMKKYGKPHSIVTDRLTLAYIPEFGDVRMTASLPSQICRLARRIFGQRPLRDSCPFRKLYPRVVMMKSA
jgi:putative transposase